MSLPEGALIACTSVGRYAGTRSPRILALQLNFIQALARYAQLVLVACDVLKDQDLTRRSLERLKAAMDQFSTNKQKFGLVYESKSIPTHREQSVGRS